MKNFFYFIASNLINNKRVDKYLICDLDFSAKSERTFDLNFFDLANNEKLLDKLQLYYMQGNYGVTYSYQSRAEWFAGYLSAFYNRKDGRYEKLKTNPQVRLLVTDDKLLKEVRAILSLKHKVYGITR